MPKQKRLYSLYKKVGARWEKQSNVDLFKAQAIRVFQTRLINGSMNGERLELRPVPKSK